MTVNEKWGHKPPYLKIMYIHKKETFTFSGSKQIFPAPDGRVDLGD